GGDDVALLLRFLRRLLLRPPGREHGFAAAADLGPLRPAELYSGLTLTQEPVGEDGNDRQRHEQRRQQSDRRGQGEGPKHLPGLAGDEGQRQEHGHRRQRRGGDGTGDLGDGGEDVRELVTARGVPSSDRLDDDDRVVDDASDGDRQRPEGEHIQRLPAHPQADQRDEEGQRDRDRGDDRRPHGEQ